MEQHAFVSIAQKFKFESASGPGAHQSHEFLVLLEQCAERAVLGFIEPDFFLEIVEMLFLALSPCLRVGEEP